MSDPSDRHRTSHSRRSMVIACLLLTSGAPIPRQEDREEPPEVRQLVTFKLLPGRSTEVINLFRREALPLYRASSSMLRFRAYREAESPEPLDIVVVSTFAGMAGMDRSNRELSLEAESKGTSIAEVYGRIGAETELHRDEFVEMIPGLRWGNTDEGRLLMLESIQVQSGERDGFPARLAHEMLAWERNLGHFSGSETGRFLIASSWDFLRVHGFDELGDVHAYIMAAQKHAGARTIDRLVASRKRVILHRLPELSVR